MYRAIDELNGRWVAIERRIFGEAFPKEISLVLDELTSVYFEGERPDGISSYGYSRDHRGDRPADAFGGGERCSRYSDPHLGIAGNWVDTTTPAGLLATFRRRSAIQEAVFVFDRGMSSKVNFEAMEQLELKHLTRLSADMLG